MPSNRKQLQICFTRLGKSKTESYLAWWYSFTISISRIFFELGFHNVLSVMRVYKGQELNLGLTERSFYFTFISQKFDFLFVRNLEPVSISHSTISTCVCSFQFILVCQMHFSLSPFQRWICVTELI